MGLGGRRGRVLPELQVMKINQQMRTAEIKMKNLAIVSVCIARTKTAVIEVEKMAIVSVCTAGMRTAEIEMPKLIYIYIYTYLYICLLLFFPPNSVCCLISFKVYPHTNGTHPKKTPKPKAG